MFLEDFADFRQLHVLSLTVTLTSSLALKIENYMTLYNHIAVNVYTCTCRLHTEV